MFHKQGMEVSVVLKKPGLQGLPATAWKWPGIRFALKIMAL